MQRYIDVHELDDCVTEAVAQMPGLPGVPRTVQPSVLVLPLHLLLHLPEASNLVRAAVGLVQEAVRLYLTPDLEQPCLRSDNTDVMAIDSDSQVLALAAALVSAEPFFPLGGGSTGHGPWQVNLDDRWVREYRGVTTAEQLFSRQRELAEAHHPQQHFPDLGFAEEDDLDSNQPADPASYEFDVALSFAGEDRVIVKAVAQGLKARGIKVFYDRDYKAALWGENLVEYFDSMYRSKARFAIMFISQHYAAKDWTRLERRSALARAMTSADAYVLPVRLDDTDLPGLIPTVGFLDARLEGVGGIVAAVSAKLSVPDEDAAVSTLVSVPSTPDEIEIVRRLRPTAWEYLLFAGALMQHRARLQERYRDYLLEYSPPAQTRLSDDEANEFVTYRLRECAALIEAMGRLIGPSPQARAFGEPGEPGDPDLILQLAERFCEYYALLLDWTRRVRSCDVEKRYKRVMLALAEFSRQPIEEFHRFVDTAVTEVGRASSLLASPEFEHGPNPVEISLVFEVEVPDAVSQEFDAALQSLKPSSRPFLRRRA